jgi:signal transduction histidine kinase
VLVVDDDPTLLAVIEMRVEAMGFEVTATHDPRAALRALEDRRFDVALFDLRMEAMDGIALTHAAHERQARLPVLIMTAHGTIESAVHAIKRGAFDYLTKPFAPEELRRKIERAIAERRWARDRGLLRTLGETLASSSEIDRTLDAVAQATLEATETERALVFLVDESGPLLRASAGASSAPVESARQVATQAMRRGQPTAVAGEGDRHTLAAPLLVSGMPHGAVVVESPAYVVPTEGDLELLALFAAQAAVALRNANELTRLRSGALAALGRVATEVAHELNNPLNGLKLHTAVLGERLVDAGDTEGASLATRMERTVDHLAELVGDILSFGRPKALDRRPTPLEPLVEESLALAQDRIERQAIEVSIRLEAIDGEFMLDGRELRRVLLNLVLNALDAMGQGGRLTIEGRLVSGSELELSVSDTGCGMDAETRGRIFDLFFTTKEKGTGLGMAIVRSAIERHGGRIEVESAPGRGTRIALRLPIVVN